MSSLCSEYCLCDQDIGDDRALQVSCLQCFIHASITTALSESNVIQMMTNTIFPILLGTIIKGYNIIHIDITSNGKHKYINYAF